MEINLRPKRIIVVGASRGIGFATAQRLLDNGAEGVLLAARNREKLEKTVSKLKVGENQRADILEFDITKIDCQESFIREAERISELSGGGGGRTRHIQRSKLRRFQLERLQYF